MTNWEKYKKDLLEILIHSVAVSKNSGEPYVCNGSISCNECIFSEYSGGCNGHTKDWLNAEYKPPKDTLEVATLISYLKMEPNQMKQVKSIKIVDGMPVINGGE